MVSALQDAKVNADGVKDIEKMPEMPIQCASYNTTATFTDNDLLLEFKPHNQPLFVIGYITMQKANCILMDGGLVINIMLKSTE